MNSFKNRFLWVIAPLLLLTLLLTALVSTQNARAANVFTVDLKEGDSHGQVLLLQQLLNLLGFTVATEGPGSRGEETVYFGPATKNAVIRYQQNKGIDPIGLVGPQTRAALNSSYSGLSASALYETITITPPEDSEDASQSLSNNNPVLAFIPLSESESRLVSGTSRNLYKFSVTVPRTVNNIGLYKFTFRAAASGGTTSNSFRVDNFKVYGYSDPNFTQTAYGSSGLLNNSELKSDVIISYNSNRNIETYFNPVAGSGSNKEIIVVPVGQTRYFLLKGDITGVTSTTTLNMELLGDQVAPLSFSSIPINSNFIWSSDHPGYITDDTIWNNGYLVLGYSSGSLGAQLLTPGGSSTGSTPATPTPIDGNQYVSGTVTYEDGAPVINAKVFINRIERQTSTPNGSFAININDADIRKGALYRLHVEVNEPNTIVIAANNRANTPGAYNWQAYGLNCGSSVSSDIVDCEYTINRLYDASPSAKADYIKNAKANDLPTDNFKFIVKKIAPTSSSPISRIPTAIESNSTPTRTSPTPTAPTSDTTPESVILPDIKITVVDESGNPISTPVTAVINKNSNNPIPIDIYPGEVYTVKGSDLKFRQGAFFSLSLNLPSGYDYVRAKNGRQANASSFEWQVLGANCAGSVTDCLYTMDSLGLKYNDNEYYSLASQNDLVEDNFIFQLGKFQETPIRGQIFYEDGHLGPKENIKVSLNNGLKVATTDVNGDFSFSPREVGFVNGASFSLRITPPSGYRSQATILPGGVINQNNYTCGADKTGGICVIGVNYEYQILGESCNGRTDGNCIGKANYLDLPVDDKYFFRLKSCDPKYDSLCPSASVDKPSGLASIFGVFSDLFRAIFR